MKQRFCVGLTGGVGSGKSTVSRILAELGVAVVDTDAIAHGLTGPKGAAMAAIAQRFGHRVLAPDGALDRAAMRQLAFADVLARRDLETILHPLIRAESLRQRDGASGSYVVMVVPLLAEHLEAYRPLLDRIAVVDAEPDQQVARTAQRPGVDQAQARAIVAAQSGRAERLAIADDVIENLGNLADLRAAVEALHRRYLVLADARATA